MVLQFITGMTIEADLSYFDAIIVCMSKELGAKVITTDKRIRSKTKIYCISFGKAFLSKKRFFINEL